MDYGKRRGSLENEFGESKNNGNNSYEEPYPVITLQTGVRVCPRITKPKEAITRLDYVFTQHQLCVSVIGMFAAGNTKGLCKEKIQIIRDYYGSGWVSIGINKICFGKSSQNSSKAVLIFWIRIPCILSVCIYTYIVESC